MSSDNLDRKMRDLERAIDEWKSMAARRVEALEASYATPRTALEVYRLLFHVEEESSEEQVNWMRDGF